MIFRRKPDPSSAGFFEKKYKNNADPWNFSTSEYEQGRYDAIVAALRHRRYRNAFEPGCSIGALTEKLVPLCDRIEAIDFSTSAIAAARQRCLQPQVEFRVMSLPERLPLENFDLIVLSEIGYYFPQKQWEEMVAFMVSTSAPGTTFLATHWLGISPDHKTHGDDVHRTLRAIPNLHLLQEERHPGFRLDRWERIGDAARSK